MNEPLATTILTCPSCGVEILKGADTCEECGMDLQDLSRIEPTNALGRTLEDPLRSLNPPQPVTASPNESIRMVAEAMIGRRHGAVCIVDEGKVVGIFTERDIVMRVAGKGYDLGGTSISEVMTRDPLCLTVDNTVAQALHQMSVGGLRHIPILEHGRLVGITTVRGILAYLVGKAML